MPSKIRLQRISDRIRQELSEMLVKEVADPRLSGISVTDVKVDRELAWADVFVSAVEGQDRSKEVLAGLRSAVGFLRHELAARVDLRAFPRLRFHWDPTPERADHIEKILATLREEEAQRAALAGPTENEDVEGAAAEVVNLRNVDIDEVDPDDEGIEAEVLDDEDLLDEDLDVEDLADEDLLDSDLEDEDDDLEEEDLEDEDLEDLDLEDEDADGG